MEGQRPRSLFCHTPRHRSAHRLVRSCPAVVAKHVSRNCLRTTKRAASRLRISQSGRRTQPRDVNEMIASVFEMPRRKDWLDGRGPDFARLRCRQIQRHAPRVRQQRLSRGADRVAPGAGARWHCFFSDSGPCRRVQAQTPAQRFGRRSTALSTPAGPERHASRCAPAVAPRRQRRLCRTGYPPGERSLERERSSRRPGAGSARDRRAQRDQTRMAANRGVQERGQ